ncbi:hypothetical protein [Chloroflexus sp.]|uniref:hypothetical protein n=1 Tax=Chloroflexus sp. TaxID=1904827 RepID=UPI002ACD8EDD|nr:hypothetical protein [Chloroflexus sp.]
MSVVSQTYSKSRNQAGVTMAFILMLALSGLENLVAEIIPQLEIGPLEIGISSFFFVPLVLAILFNNWWVALAAPIGELIFADLVLGEFGGLGEFEEVVLFTIGLMVAASIARDPKNSFQVLIAGLVGYLVIELPATLIDITKVAIGVAEFEAVEGLPESILVVEGIDFLIEYIVTGVIFGALPAMWLAPRLYGKLEPLLGMKPRDPQEPAQSFAPLWGVGIVAVFVAGLIAILAELGFSIIEWEPEFLDSIGEWWIWVGIALAAAIAAIVLFVANNKKSAT